MNVVEVFITRATWVSLRCASGLFWFSLPLCSWGFLKYPDGLLQYPWVYESASPLITPSQPQLFPSPMLPPLTF